MKYKIEAADISDIGTKRTINEDRILSRICNTDNGSAGLFVVADGVGGGSFGTLASELVTNELNKWWNKNLYSIKEGIEEIEVFGESIEETILTINNLIFSFSALSHSKIATTLTLLFIYNEKYLIKHIGDSRLYKINDENVIQMTEDHTCTNMWYRMGLLSKKEAERQMKNSMLTRCIGMVDCLDMQQNIEKLRNENLFILCTDGLYKHIPNDDYLNYISKLVVNSGELDTISKGIVNKLRQNDVSDNVSLIIVRVLENGICSITEKLTKYRIG